VIGVDNRDMALLPGMTANLQIVTDERPNALRVPNAALRFRPNGASVTPATPVLADEGGAPRRGGRPFQEMRERLAAEVQPTAEQAAAIDRILTEARSGVPARDGGLSDEERRSAMRQVRREVQDKIAAVLDPERRARYEAIVAEARRGNAGDGGTPGRVYVLGSGGSPAPVAVRLGVTDGSHTEVLAGDLKEGAGVITGGGPRTQQPADSSPARPRGPRLF
jgi:HlyD family secretion protein